MATYREISRAAYAPPKGENIGCETLNTGCLQRIADATEKMAERYDCLIRERDRYQAAAHTKALEIEHLRRRISAYKATVTRMKRAAAKARPS